MKQKQREKSWKPATEFKLTKLKSARVKSDAEWRTISDKHKEIVKQQIRKPRWTIK